MRKKRLIKEAGFQEYGKIDAEDGNPPSKIGQGSPEYMEAYNAVLVARGEEPLPIVQPDQAYLDALQQGKMKSSDHSYNLGEEEEDDVNQEVVLKSKMNCAYAAMEFQGQISDEEAAAFFREMADMAEQRADFGAIVDDLRSQISGKPKAEPAPKMTNHWAEAKRLNERYEGMEADLEAVTSAVQALGELKDSVHEGWRSTIMNAMLELNKIQNWIGKHQQPQGDLGERIAEALSRKLKEYGWDDDDDEFGGEDLSQYEKEFPDAFNAGGDRDDDAEAAAAKDAEIEDLMGKYGMSDGEPEEEEVDEAVKSDGRTPEQVELANKVAEIMETDPDYQFTLKRFVEKFLRYSQSGGSVESSLEAACPDWVPGQDIFSVVKKAQEQMGATTMKESDGGTAEQFADENGLSVEYDNEGQVVLYADAEQQAQMRMSGADRVIADEGWAIEPMADGQVAIYTDEYAGGGAIDRGYMEEPEDGFGSPAHYQEDTDAGHSQLRHSRLNETLMKWAIK